MGCGGCRGNKYTAHIEPTVDSPRALPDGGIQFPPNDVPTIKGYKPDEETLNVLYPTGKHCEDRMTGLMLEQDGSFDAYHVCTNESCEHNSRAVTFDICNTCPLRRE